MKTEVYYNKTKRKTDFDEYTQILIMPSKHNQKQKNTKRKKSIEQDSHLTSKYSVGSAFVRLKPNVWDKPSVNSLQPQQI